MNINVHIPFTMLERLLSAVERIATAAERIAGPLPNIAVLQDIKPYPASMWEEVTNVERQKIAEEERHERAGFGREYQSTIEAAVPKPSNGSDG